MPSASEAKIATQMNLITITINTNEFDYNNNLKQASVYDHLPTLALKECARRYSETRSRSNVNCSNRYADRDCKFWPCSLDTFKIYIGDPIYVRLLSYYLTLLLIITILRWISPDSFATETTKPVSQAQTKARNSLATPWISVQSSSFPASFGGIIAHITLAMDSHHFSCVHKQLIK